MLSMSAGKASTTEETALAAPARVNWAAIAWFALLLLAAYGPVLDRLVRQWLSDPDMGHGLLVPFVAAYVAWGRRHELAAAPRSVNWWGLPVVIYGSLQMMIGTLGAELFLSRTAFLISLTGALLLLCGLPALRILAFPLFLLAFMIPIPRVIFNQIALPLQLLASQVAETVLVWLGIPVLREGNILELASQRLNVVEACSGIRSLMSLAFLALVYAYFFDEKPWMRAALLAASVPIAILANAGRVAVTGILSEYDPALAEGFFHSAEGWVIFLISLAALFLTHRLINATYALVRKSR
jgi:exosortase